MQKDNFYKNVFRLAIPVATQNMLSTCANLVDTAMVASLGNAEVSAVGVSGKWMFLINIMVLGIGAGASAQISQYYGADEKENMKRTQCTALVFCIGVALVYLLAALLFPRQLIAVFNDEPEVIKAGVEYIRIAALGVIPLAIANICAVARRSVEDVKVPMYIAGVSVLINTCLNYTFIYGNFGAPALGVKGAALATTISLTFQAIAFITIGIVKKHFSIIAFKSIGDISRDFVKKFMKISLPAVFNEEIWGGGIMICAAIFARQGSDNYAAYTIFDSVSSITFIFFQGLGAASAVLIGKTVGAGKLNEAYDMAKKFMIATPILGLIAGGLLIALRKPILMLFDIETMSARMTVETLIIIFGIWLGMRMISYTGVCGIFRAGGDSKFGVYLDLIGLYCFAIPAVLIAAYLFKAPFVVLVATMMIVEDSAKVPITLYYLRSRRWIKRITQSSHTSEDQNV
ncbi:MAG: MATE family efflux transporter [Clostridia bacterium]|nr:MATE family efflux transporter [Clostridia bacterium]